MNEWKKWGFKSWRNSRSVHRSPHDENKSAQSYVNWEWGALATSSCSRTGGRQGAPSGTAHLEVGHL